MTAKIGRPKIPKGKQKIPFSIRFERNLVAAFKMAAKRSRMDIRAWVTSTLTEAAKGT
jgi:hypothetical protein